MLLSNTNFFLFIFIVIYSTSLVESCSSFDDEFIFYPKFYTTRLKRDTFELKLLKVGNLTIELDAESNNNLVIAPKLKAEWFDSTDSIKSDRALYTKCEFKLGKVRDSNDYSFVAVSICNKEKEFIGYVNVNNSIYFFQPLINDNDEEQGDKETLHRFYHSRSKRQTKSLNSTPSLALVEQLSEPWLFNLTGDDAIDIGIELEKQTTSANSKQTTMLGNDDDTSAENDNTSAKNSVQMKNQFIIDKIENWRREQLDDEDMGYFFDTAWTVQQPTTKIKTGKGHLETRWLEIALAVDYTLINFHGKSKVEQYVLSLMNIVNAIYQDGSLDANIRLVVTRLLLYPLKKQSVVRPGNAKKSLENVNSWNEKLHKSLAPSEHAHDLAVWLTRSDIGGPSGYAPVGGVCDPKRSCALNRDEGLTSAFIIAHEMAHILGLSHDGDKKHSNQCNEDTDKGSVMSPLVAATFQQFTWSTCSKMEFKKLAKKWGCLSNSPPGLNEIVLNATLQTTFSMDEQCRMEFGEGYGLCRSFDIIEPCSHLWCGHEKSPLVCKTKKGSPLEGSECGANRWCYNGYCEEMTLRNSSPVILNPQDGGWSDWSPWGPCSRSCGMGVQFRTRKCNNPIPLHGGDGCSGIREKWRICNKQSCPEPWGDMRAQQCKRLPKLLNLVGKTEWNMTWLPYESDEFDKKCKLICLSANSKKLFETLENLIDGTPCSYENSDNICIQGVCQLVGCDGQLFSKLKTDMCGICGGNNSNCTNIQSETRKRLKREITRVAVVPKMASQIKIYANITANSIKNATDPSVAFILKNRRKKKYTITIPHNELKTEIIEGTKFFYEKTSNHHKIWAKGPVLAEMVILVYASISEIEKGLNVSLHSQYIINKAAILNRNQSNSRFKWILGGWGPCSASCGGGKRQKTVACWDDVAKKLVRRKHCSLMTKPSLKAEKCNVFDCHFQWVPGKWEPCSATCGLHGIQHRELYCLPKAILNRLQITKNNNTLIEEPWKHMVNPTKCSGITPITSRPCNREACFNYWAYGEWSLCSESCGEGVMYRSSYCPPPENENFYTCGEAPPPTQKKFCYGESRWTQPMCRKRSKRVCLEDKSDLCALFHLHKYCKLGNFRRLCCKSCQSTHLNSITQ